MSTVRRRTHTMETMMPGKTCCLIFPAVKSASDFAQRRPSRDPICTKKGRDPCPRRDGWTSPKRARHEPPSGNSSRSGAQLGAHQHESKEERNNGAERSSRAGLCDGNRFLLEPIWYGSQLRAWAARRRGRADDTSDPASALPGPGQLWLGKQRCSRPRDRSVLRTTL